MEDGALPGLANGPNGYHNWGGNTPIQEPVDEYEMADGSKFSWSNPTHASGSLRNRDPRFSPPSYMIRRPGDPALQMLRKSILLEK